MSLKLKYKIIEIIIKIATITNIVICALFFINMIIFVGIYILIYKLSNTNAYNIVFLLINMAIFDKGSDQVEYRSRPESALTEIGLGHEDYENIALGVSPIELLSRGEQENILDRFELEMPTIIKLLARSLKD